MESMRGLYSGKTRSTPSPYDSLRTVKEELRPRLRRAMQTPSKAWTRPSVPSTTSTSTRTVLPGAKAGGRSAERRVGQECRHTYQSRVWQYHKKIKHADCTPVEHNT